MEDYKLEGRGTGTGNVHSNHILLYIRIVTVSVAKCRGTLHSNARGSFYSRLNTSQRSCSLTTHAILPKPYHAQPVNSAGVGRKRLLVRRNETLHLSLSLYHKLCSMMASSAANKHLAHISLDKFQRFEAWLRENGAYFDPVSHELTFAFASISSAIIISHTA